MRRGRLRSADTDLAPTAQRRHRSPRDAARRGKHAPVIRATYAGGMEQRTLHAPVDALTDVDRPDGVEIATLTRYDIPTMAVLTLDAYGDETSAENVLEASEHLRMAFDGAFGPATDDSFVGAWDGGALVGAILVVRESPWDDAPDGPFVIDLVVDPEYRRRGIATALVAEIAKRSKEWGFETLALRIDSRHLGAAELYGGLGFEEVV